MNRRKATAKGIALDRKSPADVLSHKMRCVFGIRQSTRTDGLAKARPRPTSTCLPLPAFDADSIDAVRSAFAAAVPVCLGQAWRKKLERRFSPGQVRVGWQKNCLLLFAELTDKDVFTNATAANQRMWELGDTFEIFLQAKTSPGYIELHVTPNNLHLQLRFPRAGAVKHLRRHGMDGYLIQDIAFRSRSWVQPDKNTWSIYAEVPAAMLGGPNQSLRGQQWRFSFCRYDYTRSKSEPVISSTSPYTEPDFHRSKEWGVLNFVPVRPEKICS